MIKLCKEELQRMSRVTAEYQAKTFLEENKKQIISSALKGCEQFDVLIEEYQPYFDNPNFKNKLEELSECKVTINHTTAYCKDIPVEKNVRITFDWSDD